MHTLSNFKKADVIELDGVQYIIMASVPDLWRPGNVYNICTTELLASRFGVRLEWATLVPTTLLSEIIKKRVKNFL